MLFDLKHTTLSPWFCDLGDEEVVFEEVKFVAPRNSRELEGVSIIGFVDVFSSHFVSYANKVIQ
jgi:hypothetical protein